MLDILRIALQNQTMDQLKKIADDLKQHGTKDANTLGKLLHDALTIGYTPADCVRHALLLFSTKI